MFRGRHIKLDRTIDIQPAAARVVARTSNEHDIAFAHPESLGRHWRVSRCLDDDRCHGFVFDLPNGKVLRNVMQAIIFWSEQEENWSLTGGDSYTIRLIARAVEMEEE